MYDHEGDWGDGYLQDGDWKCDDEIEKDNVSTYVSTDGGNTERPHKYQESRNRDINVEKHGSRQYVEKGNINMYKYIYVYI
jgi:hypothetical protein